ncbi:MAG: protocatechuate 3,4-dioxygenase [Myxococcota bacterium]
MVDKATYPNAFAAEPAACLLLATTTAGPCTTENPAAREDISAGSLGLPVRLALRIVDGACSPIAGATINIWHTTVGGSYTGQTPNNGFCVLDETLSETNAFRGTQPTDANGVVFFDTCFPGWYPGRAIHIHYEVLVEDRSSHISQVFFPEAITAEIFESHPDYAPFGQPDTLFATDGVLARIPPADATRHVLEVARMSDGAMLASGTLTVA